jgi:hypothetical protein
MRLHKAAKSLSFYSCSLMSGLTRGGRGNRREPLSTDNLATNKRYA